MTDAPPDDQPKNELDFVRTWLDAIELSEKEEKDWRDTADRACETYRGGMPKSSSVETNLNTFNLFHANVETLVPALYNSTPIPDVRRRFNDPDPIAKEVSELYERAISYQIDAYDFDQTMLSSVRDMAITSRGIIRVRYEPTFDSDQLVSYEEVNCEYVPWRTFRRGPGKTWKDIPWIAFEELLSYSEVEKLLEGEKEKARILKEMRFTYTAEPKKTPEEQADGLSKLSARARVWEIWDKGSREVHFISPDYALRRLTSVDDPLELTEFYPIPRPLSAIQAPDSLVPITLLQVYETLLEELNIVQRRIMRLTNQLRARGWYAGLNDTDIQSASSAEDGELTPLTGVEAMMAQGTDISKAITYWPLDTIAKALESLVNQRELIKQTIYEVTGLSDIVRGASDARETATAQQIKSQWGTLRIQRMQAEVARFSRDLFRLKSQIMARKFSFETVMKMASLNYPTKEEKQQAQQHLQIMQQSGQPPDPKIAEILKKPAREDVERLFKDSDGFRVDIESDSTIRGDVQRNQEQQALFLQGTAQYLQAVGPLVQEGVMPPDVAVEIYAGFARSFRLGKQAEDAIDRLADEVKQSAGQPKPPSPEQVKAEAEQKKMAAQAEADKQKHAGDMEKMAADAAREREKHQMEMERLAAEKELAQINEFNAQQEHQRKLIDAEQKEMFDRQRQEDEFRRQGEQADAEHGRNMQTEEAKARFAAEADDRKAANDAAAFMRTQEAADNDEKRAAQAFQREQTAAKAKENQKSEQPKPEKIDLSPILKAIEKLDGRLDKLEAKKPTTSKMVRDKEGRLEAIVQG